MKDVVVRITSSYFCAGVVVGERAAPILRYMAKWRLRQIVAYCEKKGWTYEIME